VSLLLLGRLELAGHDSPQRQALLLLAYLHLEGRKERGYLAELFWPEAKRPLNNLSSAMTRIRALDPHMIGGDRYTVEATVSSDAEVFVSQAVAGRHDEALDLYHGRFLDGFPLSRLGAELQEWVLFRREVLAGMARDCALELAEEAHRNGRTEASVSLAAQAIELGGDAVPDPQALLSLYRILHDGHGPGAAAIRSEALELGVPAHELDDSHDGQPSPRTVARPEDRPDQTFLGREVELVEVLQALETKGAAAVTGLGGVGKTELVRTLVDQVGDRFGPSAWVDGATVPSIELLPEAISRAAAPEAEPASSVDDLLLLLGGRRLLLILDDMDRFANDLDRLGPLLEGDRRITLLVTSRSEVDLAAAAVISLEGLATNSPDGAGPGPARQLFDALFRRRAPLGAHLDPEDRAVEQICDRLGGLPLGIELAAGWLSVLTPAEIVDGLTDTAVGVDLLEDPDRGVADHHASFESVMAGTWDLLDERCRDGVARLSIVPSGCSRNVAEAVANCTLPVLRRLAGWSLVKRVDGGHYQMHPLVRSFARAKLAEIPSQELEAKWAHARFVLDAVADVSLVDSFESDAVLPAFEDPVGNLVAVWRLLADERDVDGLTQLADPLDRVLSRFGRLHTLRDVVDSTIDDLGPETPLRIHHRLHMHLIWLLLRLGDYQRAKAMADVVLGPDGTDRAVESDVLVEVTRARSAIDRTEGQVERAIKRLEGVRATAAEVSNRMGALVDDDLGLCQMILGHYEASRRSYRGVLAWARREGSQPMIAWTLLSMGLGHLESDELVDARALLLEARSVATVHQLDHVAPYIDVKLARVHLAMGDEVAAAGAVAAARRQDEASLEPWLAVELDLVAGRVIGASQNLAEMWRLVGRALDRAQQLEDVPFVAKAYLALIELALDHTGLDVGRSGGCDLTRAVAAPTSGADHADRMSAAALVDQLDCKERSTDPPAVMDVGDTATSLLRLAKADG
jgi:hypothetical protein